MMAEQKERMFWHIQLHPDDPLPPERIRTMLERKHLIGVGEDKKGNAYVPAFQQTMAIGHIVLVRAGATPVALVEVVGDCVATDQPNDELDWFKYRRPVKVLGWADGGWDPFPQPRKTLERLVNDTSSRTYVENKYKHFRGLAMLEEIKELLKANRQIVLTGAPGTGKTYLARELAADLLGCSASELKDREAFRFIQFHPAYDYTDFVEGLKPVQVNGSIAFELRSGIFRKFCEKAKEEKRQPFVFVIDEINRADLSRVFGELFYALEPDYRGERGQVLTQYSSLRGESDRSFYVPNNVLIIGTMNDIDRSVESMDFALRRRFAWFEVEADEARFDAMMSDILVDTPELKQNAKERYTRLNDSIAKPEDGLGPAYRIGPAYFRKLEDYRKLEEGEMWKKFWDYHLKLLIREYVRGMSKSEELEKKFQDAYNLKLGSTEQS